ncbi:MAG: hypothetical protein RXR17_04625 [Sulfolobaceae archaeon]|jgi:hypothetical protein
MKSHVYIKGKKGLGTVIGIVIFIMILLIALALILSYLRDFQAVGAQLSQAQINIYNHNNAKLQIVNTSTLYKSILLSQQSCTYNSTNGKIYKFNVTITCYYDPTIMINVSNPSQITQTIEYLIISAGSPNAKNTNLIGTNQTGNPPNYQTFAYLYLAQLVQTYIGETIAPLGSLGLNISTQDLFSPYYQQNNPSSAPIDLYIPYKYYKVNISCQEETQPPSPPHPVGPIHYYYYAYYQYDSNTLYYPYYGAPPYLPGTEHVPTDYNKLPNNPVYPYGNVYAVMFNNWGDVYSCYIPLQYPGGG